MEILHVCPAKVATGGTESIHKLVSELNKVDGVYARILYVGDYEGDPQPEDYARYHCGYVTMFPEYFSGCVIFPEIYGNDVIDPKYESCIVAINWAGVDVYDWSVPKAKRGLYLKRKDCIHLAQSEYAMDHLRKLGLKGIKIEDVLNEDFFFDKYINIARNNLVLYNGAAYKLTQFQKMVMQRCRTEYGIRFQPLSGFTRHELIDLFYQCKLYIDFGVFSGRERLPREAAMCGCCVLTSRTGAAGYHEDVPIPDKYKFTTDQVDEAMKMIIHVLANYDQCKHDFDEYRTSLVHDRDVLPDQVKELCNEIFNHNSSV